jgi:signal peptide peptidase SppA
MKEILKIKQSLANNPWLITQECFVGFYEAIEYCADINEVDLKESAYEDNGVAVIPIHGTIMRNVDAKVAKFFGISDTMVIQENLQRALEDPNITHVLLDVDSGGGSVTGVQETADMIKAVDKEKPVYAICEGMMASAAYWMGSQARVVMSSKSAKVGSIGVYLPVIDNSEYYKAQGVHVELIKNKEATFKGAGFEGTSLTNEQKENLQEMVQEIYTEFSTSVLSARPQIAKQAMQGQVFLGAKSKGMGLVDIIGNYDDAINLLINE